MLHVKHTPNTANTRFCKTTPCIKNTLLLSISSLVPLSARSRPFAARCDCPGAPSRLFGNACCGHRAYNACRPEPSRCRLPGSIQRVRPKCGQFRGATRGAAKDRGLQSLGTAGYKFVWRYPRLTTADISACSHTKSWGLSPKRSGTKAPASKRGSVPEMKSAIR